MERSSCLQEPPGTAGLEQRGLAHPGRKEQAWGASHLNTHDKPGSRSGLGSNWVPQLMRVTSGQTAQLLWASVSSSVKKMGL